MKKGLYAVLSFAVVLAVPLVSVQAETPTVEVISVEVKAHPAGDEYREVLVELVKLLTAQLELLQDGGTIESLVLLQPDAGDEVNEGSSLRVSWKGGLELLPVSVRVLTNSANYYCVKAGTEVCPLDVSIPVLELEEVNDGRVTLLLPKGVTGGHIVEVCQLGACSYTEELIRIVE